MNNLFEPGWIESLSRSVIHASTVRKKIFNKELRKKTPVLEYDKNLFSEIALKSEKLERSDSMKLLKQEFQTKKNY